MMEKMPEPVSSRAGPDLRELAWMFLRLGLLGFGGPIAVIALMEKEAVRVRRWITSERFSEMYAVCKLLPGPVSTQMAICLGRICGGKTGGLVAGIVFILPSFLLVLALSVLYVHMGRFEMLFQGLQAGALVVVLTSTWQLARPYRAQLDAWIILVLSAVVIYQFPSYEPLVILFFALTGVLRAHEGAAGKGLRAAWLLPIAPAWATGATAVAAGSVGTTLAQLFWVCFKAGAFVFGTGLAIVPMLESDSVSTFHWLSHSAFMDGLAIGQITPGPVVITVTFIGFRAAGLLGACVATAGIFLPSFINGLYLVPLVWSRWSGTPTARGFSGGAIPAVIGGILGTSFRLGMLTLTGPLLLAAFAVSLAVALIRPIPPWLLIPLTGLGVGLVSHFVH
jgi:chromate transporter